MNFTKNKFIIENRSFFYWEAGSAQAPLMLFLHGFPGNHIGLVDLARNFSGSYRIIIPDLPACGVSSKLEEPQAVANYAKWLQTFFNQLKLPPATVVGHSFGSRIALYFAAKYPEKTERLVLITPMLKVDGFLTRIASIKFNIAAMLPAAAQKYWLFNKLYREAVGIMVFKSSSAQRKREIMERDSKEIKHLNPEVTIDLFNEFYESNFTMLGEEILQPCLIIAGDQDSIATIESIRELANKISHVKLEVMSKSGHLVPLERPKATAQVIEEWLIKNQKSNIKNQNESVKYKIIAPPRDT